MSREVMQLALDVLETEAAIYMHNDPEDGPPESMTEAIRVFRAELAKPAEFCGTCKYRDSSGHCTSKKLDES